MTPTFSLVVNHAPWATERLPTATELLAITACGHVKSMFLHDTDYRNGGPNSKDRPVLFTLNQWNWAAQQKVTHHVFMTDDLELAPGFWSILSAIVAAAPEDVIGLLSNHPKAPELAHQGYHWYRTNSWVVGPCYVVPHLGIYQRGMEDLADWAERRWPEETWDQLGWADDSELNHWVSTRGRQQSLHPIPTPIEHKREASTWTHTGHGDDYSHERVSWRTPVREFPDQGYRRDGELLRLCATPEWWAARAGPQESPMLELPK